MKPTSTAISDRISRIVRLVDSQAWKGCRVASYRIISECQELTEGSGARFLTDSERQWLTGVIVWISETLEDSARGEGVYMD